jgi:hypothetical protein
MSRRSRLLSLGLLAVLALLALSGATVRAEDPPSTDVERRLRELEQTNAELRKRVDGLEGERTAAVASLSASQTAPEGTPEGVDPPEESVGLGLSTHYGPIKLNFQTFGDVGLHYYNPPPVWGASRADWDFFEGSIDFCTSVAIYERFHVLSEIVLEGDQQSGDVGVDVERLWAKYAFGDALCLKLGAEHSPLVHYNRLFHHGRWMWTGATSPLLARFEDSGGLLPTHIMGLEASGRFDVGIGSLEYVATVGDGRALTNDFRSRIFNVGPVPTFAGSLGFSPAGVNGFQTGFAFLSSDIPKDASNPLRQSSIREFIESAYIDYRAHGLEVLGEVTLIQHKVRKTNESFEHKLAYLQAGYKIGDFTPYARFDLQATTVKDPYYETNNRDLPLWQQVLGVRYDLCEFVALKAEPGFGRLEVRNPTNGETHHRWGFVFTADVAWVF